MREAFLRRQLTKHVLESLVVGFGIESDAVDPCEPVEDLPAPARVLSSSRIAEGCVRQRQNPSCVSPQDTIFPSPVEAQQTDAEQRY